MRVPYSVLLVVNLIIAYLLNHHYKMQQTQNIKIQELQKRLFDLQLESIKTLTPEQKAEIFTELFSRVGGSTEVLTPVQIGEIVTEILHGI